MTLPSPSGTAALQGLMGYGFSHHLLAENLYPERPGIKPEIFCMPSMCSTMSYNPVPRRVVVCVCLCFASVSEVTISVQVP